MLKSLAHSEKNKVLILTTFGLATGRREKQCGCALRSIVNPVVRMLNCFAVLLCYITEIIQKLKKFNHVFKSSERNL